MPLAFTDEMLDRVMHAASLLPTNARDSFLKSVANRVSDLPYQAGVPEIEQAIAFVLNARGVGGGIQAFTSTKTTDKIATARAGADQCFRTGVSL